MTAPPPWSAVRALFDQALPLDTAARDVLFASHAGEPALVAEVRSLLAHHEAETGGVLSGSALAPLAAGERSEAGPADRAGADGADGADGDLRAGQRVGPWRVVSLLGRGGMGEVWLAERDDGAFKGQAAIKVLKRGMDSAAVLARFASEQQALARLAHPHIARLFDAGRTEGGLPYFVMESVRGRPIDQACAARTLRERLVLFLQLSDAVAHAHRNLLVHRDLKPSNVMVDDEGRVKLLDFGIAKALDPSGAGVPNALGDAAASHTLTGERPFTPHYASPEQVRGEPVTTATDIYSLGVLLYVMLTGQRPYGRRAQSPLEAARSVLEEEPSRPSSLALPAAGWMQTRRQLEGDLDNILLKALEKAPVRRYASVDAMASDVQAYLNGYPVSARQASALYLFGKFVARHRWAMLTGGVGASGLATALAATVLQGRAAAALGVATLAVALAIALVQARRAAHARDEAAHARDHARGQLERVKRITGDLVFRYGDTVTLLPGGLKAQESLLRETVAALEPALAEAPDDMELAGTMASVQGRLAEILGNTMLAAPERAADARAAVARALELAERAWPERRADWRFASWHVRVLIVQSQLMRAERRLADAAAALQKAAERAEAALALQHGAEGRIYLAVGRANAHLNRAQLFDHANLPSLGEPERALHEYELAERALRAVLDGKDELAEFDRNAPPGDASCESYLVHQVGTIIGGRALIHLSQEDLAAARREIEQALPLRQQNLEREPRNVAWRDGLMSEANTCALILLRQGEFAAALTAANLAWQTAEALARDEGPGSRWAGAAVRALLAAQRGPALVKQGQAELGLEVLELGLRHWQALCAMGPAPGGDTDEHARMNAQRRAAWFEVQRAGALHALGRAAEAIASAQAALARLPPSMTADSLVGRDALLTLGEAHMALARWQPGEAASHHAAARAAFDAAAAQRRLGEDHALLRSAAA